MGSKFETVLYKKKNESINQSVKKSISENPGWITVRILRNCCIDIYYEIAFSGGGDIISYVLENNGAFSKKILALAHSFPVYRKVFWCFQGVEKGCIGSEWVNMWKHENIIHRRIGSFTVFYLVGYQKLTLDQSEFGSSCTQIVFYYT